jgi:hypothetical protein
MIPADEAQERGALLIHEFFHRLQTQLGQMLVGKPNDHLETLDGRYWMQLEWRALAQALRSAGNERFDADSSTDRCCSFRAVAMRRL